MAGIWCSLKIKETYWPSLTEEQLKAKVAALMGIGAVFIDTGWGEKQPEPEKVVEYREKVVYLYPCMVKDCNYQGHRKAALASHMRAHKLAVKVPVTR
jgi:hypothetical protein